MDISTGLGLLAGAIVVLTMIFMGGDLRMFISDHAVIIIFGGSFAATLIRFPLSSMFHGLPLGATSSSATISSAIATTSSPISTKARRSIARSAIARRLSA